MRQARNHTAVLFLLPLLFFIACSTSEDTSPTVQSTPPFSFDSLDVNVPKHARLYDTARGGLQITLIAYDQTANKNATGVNNEWIEFRCQKPMSTYGYVLNAGDVHQNYSLPDSVFTFLRIYTQAQPNMNSKYEMSLGLNSWIWNNAGDDTARLSDPNGFAVDSLSY
jgi:hypothetical protein